MMQIFSYVIRSSLSSAANMVHKNQQTVPIYGIIFDLDGTLTMPILDFKELRRQIGCPPPPVDILEYIRSKPENEKTRLLRIVEDFEDEGNRNMKLQPGVHTLLKFLAENGMKRSILTRNAMPCVEFFLENLGDPMQYGGPFSHLLTRDFTPSKPDPAPIHHICKEWGIKPCNAIMVGDHMHDIACGQNAGTVTILINNPKNGAYKEMADFNVDSLEEMITLMRDSAMAVQRHTKSHVQEEKDTNNSMTST